VSNPRNLRRLAVPFAVLVLTAAGACSGKPSRALNVVNPQAGTTVGTQPATTVSFPTTTAAPNPSRTAVVPPTTPVTGPPGTLATPHPLCDDNGNPSDSSSTWTDLVHTTTNSSGAVADVFGITNTDVLRIVFTVSVPNWQAGSGASFFQVYLYPELGSWTQSDTIYFAGPGPNPYLLNNSPPGITSGSRLLPLPPLPVGHGLFKLHLDTQDAMWDVAVQRCDGTASQSF
jgi:hypothetical protein